MRKLTIFKLLLVLCISCFSLLSKAQYTFVWGSTINGVAQSGYSTVGYQNGRLFCMGNGGWLCELSCELSQESEWHQAICDEMYTYALEAIEASPSDPGDEEIKFTNTETNEEVILKVEWHENDEHYHEINLYKWE